ncbi:MAG: esterase-like activity of phytase family protein [Rhodobacteraceae bacterium]|nr:esterase-like activity of phytase family protein [Paracoccaceae bacterium]
MYRRSSVQVTLALVLTCLVGTALADDKAQAQDMAQDLAQNPGQNPARYLSSFPWVMDKPWFGGWSGIEISPDGSTMTAITDRGRLIRARIRRDKSRITGISPRKWWRLKSSSGRFLTRWVIDSEGLALGSNGVVHISFEGVTRVARYHPPGASAMTLSGHKAFKTFPKNKSLEALAIDGRNRLFAIPEQLSKSDEIRVYVVQNGIWSVAFTLPGGNGFLPVGADFDPDGRLYLLERGWSVFGFRTRVRRWEIVSDRPQNEQLLILTGTGTHDNLEGLAVWRDKQRRTRLTMISDDNFLSLQRTEIVEYAVSE